jgi:hypothetical protein
MTCDSWSENGITGAGTCALGFHGGRPSLGLCQSCPQNTAAGIWPQLPPPPTPAASPYAHAFVLTGEPLAQRKAICAACPHLKSLKDYTFSHTTTVMVRCEKCTRCEGGRNLAMSVQACPLGLWEAIYNQESK